MPAVLQLPADLSTAIRLQVGPTATVIFESPTARRRSHGRRSGDGRLVGEVLVAEPGCRPGKGLLAVRRAVAAGWVGFRSDAGRPIPGEVWVRRSADPLVGLSLTVVIPFAATDRAAFADPRPVWRLVIQADGYAYAGDPLGWATRAALLDDASHRHPATTL